MFQSQMAKMRTHFVPARAIFLSICDLVAPTSSMASIRDDFLLSPVSLSVVGRSLALQHLKSCGSVCVDVTIDSHVGSSDTSGSTMKFRNSIPSGVAQFSP